MIEFAYRPALMTPRLSGYLDHVRWLAALAVCLSHLRTLLFPDYADGALAIKLFYFLTLFGNEAVVLFFVASGLLVGGSILKTVERGTFDTRTYTADRAARLYIVLIPAIVLSEALRFSGLSVSCGAGQGLGVTVANLLFLQNLSSVPLCNNHPLWSLSSEAFFYAVAPALLLAAWVRSLRAIAAAGILLLVGLWFWTFSYTTPLFGLLLWLAGLLPWFVRIKVPALVGAVPFVLALLLSRAHWLPDEWQNDLVLAAAFALWLCCGFEGGNVPFRRLATILAAFSYSLYLIHMPLAQAIASRIVRPLPITQASSFAVFAASLVAIVGVAALFGQLFERRTHEFRSALRRLLRV